MGRQIGACEGGHLEIWPCHPAPQAVSQDGASNGLNNPCPAPWGRPSGVIESVGEPEG